ncbi:MAG TPA: MFS transporter, partial [Caulobacteraceae bacterium]
YWGFTSGEIAGLATAVFASAFLALSLAPQASRRLGKRRAAMGAMIASMVVGLTPMMLRLAGLMPPNHSPALFWIILVQSIVSVAFYIAGSTLTSAMIADVVEDGELKTGRRAEGVYFSASIMISKAVSGAGLFAASAILGLIAFPTGVRPDHVPPAVLSHLAMTYAPIYAGLTAIGMSLLMGYQITRASHAETLETLAARAEALAVGGAE